MAIKIGSRDVTAIKAGSRDIVAQYLGARPIAGGGGSPIAAGFPIGLLLILTKAS